MGTLAKISIAVGSWERRSHALPPTLNDALYAFPNDTYSRVYGSLSIHKMCRWVLIARHLMHLLSLVEILIILLVMALVWFANDWCLCIIRRPLKFGVPQISWSTSVYHVHCRHSRPATLSLPVGLSKLRLSHLQSVLNAVACLMARLPLFSHSTYIVAWEL